MHLDLKEYEESLINKIEQHQFNFTSNEKFVLNASKNIRTIFFDTLKQNPELVTDEIADILDKIEEYEEEILENEQLLVALAKCLIVRGDFSFVSDIEQYVSEEYAEDIKNYFLTLLDNPSMIKEKGYASSIVIELALSHGKYEFLDCVTSCGELSKKAVELIKNYAEEVPIVADFLIGRQDQLQLPYHKYSVTALMHYFNTNTKPLVNTPEYATNNQKVVKPVYDEIIRKLFSNEPYEVDEMQKYLNVAFINYDKSNKRKLIELLFSKIGFAPVILWAIDDEVSEYEDLMLEAISKYDRSYSERYIWGIENILKNERIVQKLLEYGYIDIVSKSDFFERYIPFIIDKIKSNDIHYQNLIIQDMSPYFNHPELLKVLLDYNKVSSMNFSHYLTFDDKRLTEIILNEVRKGKEVTIPESEYYYDSVLETVVKTRNFKTLFKTNLNQLTNAKLSNDAIDILIEEIKKDLDFADRLLRNSMSLIFQNETLLEFYLQSNSYFIERTIDRINHEESLSKFYNDKVYRLVREYFADKYGLNINHLDVMNDKFGARIIRHIENENIHKLINLDEERFNKFINLFPDVEFKLSDMEMFYDSLMQYAYTKTYPNVINIFADIMHSLDDENNEYLEKLNILSREFNDKFYSKFGKIYPELISAIRNNPQEFLLKLVGQIKNNPEQSEYCKEVLHFITGYYIATKREQFREHYSIYKDSNFKIPYDFDETDLENKLLKYVLNKPKYQEHIIQKLVSDGFDLEFAKKCIFYLRSSRDKGKNIDGYEVRFLNEQEILFSLEEVPNIRKQLKFISSIIKSDIKNTPNRKNFINYLDDVGILKRVYKNPIPTDIYQIISLLNPNALCNVLNNDDIYNSLLQLMTKYKIHKLPDGFGPLLESEVIGLSGNYGNLSSFISYYDKIYESEKARLAGINKDSSNVIFTPKSIFSYAEIYSSVSSVYSQILGTKDAGLIKANPGSNAATRKTAGNTRLDEAIEWTKINFERTSVTVPTFTENITLDNGKVMHTVVGNFTNPSNLTHGERTGSCMRIGSVGETLFQFCLNNENGFHIRFENPTTGEYISRVSGFRNGNTVFLNELRYSCNPSDYGNDDVINACKLVAKLLIEKSKESTCPIDNVVVHTSYAVDPVKYPKTDLGVSNIKVGLPPFYCDVSNFAHVLATTNPNGEFVPLNFDKSNVPNYLPARDKAKETTNLKDIIDMMNRVTGVKALLDGESLDSIEPSVIDDSFIYGIANNDWYIYIDNKLQIHENIILLDSRAKEELAVARKRIEELLPAIEKEQTYSY